MWQTGSPKFKNGNMNCKAEMEFTATLGVRKTFVAMNVLHDEAVIKRFSSLHKAIRIIAYCNRFKNRVMNRPHSENGNLTVDELEKAKLQLIKLCQLQYFEEEIQKIRQQGEVGKKSSLRALCPFLDTDGILLVGGRLKNSSFT